MNFFRNMKDMYGNRRMIYSLARDDFKKRFVGSYFGIFWMFVQPVVTILIYYVVFQLGFKATPPSSINAPYVLWLVPGIMPWFFFSEAVLGGTNALYDYDYLVKKVVFNINVLPVIKVVSSMIVHVIFVIITIEFFLIMGYVPSLPWIQIVYYSFCTFILAVAISYFTSAINVFFKDMGQIVNILLQFGMWLTPIMWHYSMMEDFLPILKLNPFFYISEGYRSCMLDGGWFWEKPRLTVYFWIVTFVLLFIGTRVFKKLKVHFADVL